MQSSFTFDGKELVIYLKVEEMSATDSQRTNTAELWAASQRGYDSMIARLIAIIRKEATNGR